MFVTHGLAFEGLQLIGYGHFPAAAFQPQMQIFFAVMAWPQSIALSGAFPDW
jgi:hypothetical protein